MAPMDDIEMKDEPTQETIADVQQTASSDLTDPNPPPQPAPALSNGFEITAPSFQAPLHASEMPTAAQILPAPPSGFEIPIAAQPAVSSLSAPVARPSSIPPPAPVRPEKPAQHGGPTRQYLNNNITPHLLEGMKHLAMYEPEKPLAWLADFLRDRSAQIEG